MKKCIYLQLQLLLHSAAAAEKAVNTYIQAIVSLCEAEILFKYEEKAIKDFIFLTLLETAQLQKFLLRKEKLLTSYPISNEYSLPQNEFSDRQHFYNCLVTLKKLTHSLFLSTADRNTLYDLLEENKRLYKRRVTLFVDPKCHTNDPSTRWLAFISK